jgi:nucleoside-diphosphate-sugar epimerase
MVLLEDELAGRRVRIDRTRSLLGFEATLSLREGIAELVAWYHQAP